MTQTSSANLQFIFGYSLPVPNDLGTIWEKRLKVDRGEVTLSLYEYDYDQELYLTILADSEFLTLYIGQASLADGLYVASVIMRTIEELSQNGEELKEWLSGIVEQYDALPNDEKSRSMLSPPWLKVAPI